MRVLSCLVLLLCLLISAPASALFAPIPDVPVDRLINNISAYIEGNPEDAEAHYLLGRVHYLAFVLRSETLSASDPGSEGKLPNVTDWRMQHRGDKEQIDEEASLEHARKAILNFKKAVNLGDESNALHYLGLASIYEQAIPVANKIMPEVNQDSEEASQVEGDLTAQAYFIIKAAGHYATAWKLDREAAIAKDDIFLPFYPVAYEAAKAYVRLVEEKNYKGADRKVIEQMKEDIAAIDSKPMAITPIVFRIDGDSPESVSDLLAEKLIVNFDLDADGIAERRPWVNPDTAILVWDPENTGKITSGRQLFGNMTFFMLFSDGYQAMDSLDDNRDGQLAGNELKGLALWHDRNSNGISDEGEVTPITQTPVKSISTQQQSKDGIHPMNPAGLNLEDGTTRPTWDWIAPALEN